MENRIEKFSFMTEDLDLETKQYLKELLVAHPKFKDVIDLYVRKDFDKERQADIWYTYEVMNIRIGNYLFGINAVGDKKYLLYINNWQKFEEFAKAHNLKINMNTWKNNFEKDEPLEIFEYKMYGKDDFTDAFRTYFKSDEELTALVTDDNPVFRLYCENNNWLEIDCTNLKSLKKKGLTDLFSGLDIGNNFIEELKFILDETDLLIKEYKRKR